MKNSRWFYLTIGVIAMLFAGILYAWSILKSPLSAEFGWGASDLALNFTLAMSFFCIGGLLGAQISRRAGHRAALIAAGILSALGFGLTASLANTSVWMLYLTYGVLAGLGIGIAYNVVISTVNAWFPDKKGLCSGCLMMGFGASALILGNAADMLFDIPAVGWRGTYLIIGGALALVLILAGLILNKPGTDVVFPAPKAKKSAKTEKFESRDYTTFEMLRRPSFWMAFISIGLLAAVGSSVISFAKDLALSVGAEASLATTLVGVLSICNGLGRIFTGALFDLVGRRFTMLASNVLTIAAAAVTLLAVVMGSLPLCIVGLCLVGMSYGSCPTVSSAFVSSFYGTGSFATNFSIMNFNLIASSLMATVCGNLNSFELSFALLVCLGLVALVLNMFIRKP